MTITHQQALNKLDLLVLKKKQKEQQLLEAQEEIAKKDNRNFQLRKLISGSEKIFQKQYTNIYELQEKLREEQKEKGISEEKATHLQEDIKRLDDEKNELNNRIKELEDADGESKKARDKELAEEKSKVIKLTSQLENIINSNKLVFDILGTYSKKENLYLRAEEIVDNLKLMVKSTTNIADMTEAEIKENHSALLKIITFVPGIYLNALLTEYCKEKFWWDKWINDKGARETSEDSCYFIDDKLQQWLMKKKRLVNNLGFIFSSNSTTTFRSIEIGFALGTGHKDVLTFSLKTLQGYNVPKTLSSFKNSKLLFKEIYRCYRDK